MRDVVLNADENFRLFFAMNSPPTALIGPYTNPPYRRAQFSQTIITRRVVKQRPNDDCAFLASQGCLLPQDVRPLICRPHPYQYNATGITSLSSDCPTDLLSPGEDLAEAVQMNLDQANVWHAQLYEELLLEDEDL